MTAVRNRVRDTLRRLRGSEQGIALPVAILATAIGLTFAAVVVVASINTQGGDSQDQSSNSALAAAETGADVAVLRQNRLHEQLTTSKPCVEVLSKGSTLQAEVKQTNGWCKSVEMNSSTSPSAPVGTKVTYSVEPNYVAHTITVVATGSTTVGREATRRIKIEAAAGLSTAELKKIEEEEIKEAAEEKKEKEEEVKELEEQKKEEATTSYDPFIYGQVVGVESLVINNGSSVFHGGAGSNGPVTLEGSGNVCGTVQYGTTITANNGSENPPYYCASNGRPFVKGTSSYPNVTLPSNISTSNSNSRLKTSGNTVTWNSTNRSLVVSNGGTLTLEGTAPYFLCSLEVTGGATLKAAAGASIHIYFDEPTSKNCPGLNGGPQLRVWNGANIYPDSQHGPVLLFVGSATANASTIELQGGSTTQQIVIYAPRSTIKAANGITMNGILIGHKVELGGGSRINETSVFTPPSATGLFETTGTVSEAKKKEREKKKKERETKAGTREVIKRTREEEKKSAEGAFRRGSYIECSASGTLSSGC